MLYYSGTIYEVITQLH